MMVAGAWVPSNRFEEELAVVEAQLENARNWQRSIAEEIEAYNELITSLENSVQALTAQCTADERGHER